jgi:endonuclease-3
VVRRLRAVYPDATTSLHYRDAWELLVAVILSAQTTDARVNEVTPGLFRRFPGPAELLASTTEQLEDAIRPTGFFRNKARSLRGAAAYVLEHYDGVLPKTTEEMLRIPGVGRKTAAVVLGEAYGIAQGIAVDTHAGRLSRRLGLAAAPDPVRAERELMEVVPRTSWIEWTHLLIAHGRAVCTARSPRCTACVLLDICPEGQERRRAARATPTPKRA